MPRGGGGHRDRAGYFVWCMVAVWRYNRWVALVQVPLFVWDSVATVLHQSIMAMNW
jgi:translocator protein